MLYVVEILRIKSHEIFEKEFENLPTAKTFFENAREMSLFFLDEVKIRLFYVDRLFRVNVIKKYDSENPTEEEVTKDLDIINEFRLMPEEVWEEIMEDFMED